MDSTTAWTRVFGRTLHGLFAQQRSIACVVRPGKTEQESNFSTGSDFIEKMTPGEGDAPAQQVFDRTKEHDLLKLVAKLRGSQPTDRPCRPATEYRDGPIMARIGEAAAHLLELNLSPGRDHRRLKMDRRSFGMVDKIHPRKSARPLEDLGSVDRVTVLAGGAKKAEAIALALRAGVIDAIVTVKFTAQGSHKLTTSSSSLAAHEIGSDRRKTVCPPMLRRRENRWTKNSLSLVAAVYYISEQDPPSS